MSNQVLTELPNPQHGAVPKEATAQKTYFVMSDTLFVGGGAALANQTFFNKTTISQYFTGKFSDIAQQKNITILGLRISYLIKFAALGSVVLPEMQYIFENFSTIRPTIREKAYSDIPLSFMLPYDLAYNGTAITALPRNNPFFYFSEPIAVPANGNIKFDFIPATGLTAAADDATVPVLPTSGVNTNNRAFFLKLDFLAEQDRIIS